MTSSCLFASLIDLLLLTLLLLLASKARIRAPNSGESLASSIGEELSPLRAEDSPLRACKARCHCEGDDVFWSETEAAQQLFRGCKQQPRPRLKPSLLVIGAIKGGTTSFQKGGVGQICLPKHEPQFFNEARFENRSIRSRELEQYLNKSWGACSSGAMLAEKSPSYLVSGQPHLRICEVFGKQKILVLLRDPVTRVYSHFYQGEFLRGWKPSVPRINSTPECFHQQMKLEIAVANTCGGLPVGEPEEDWRRQLLFQDCCVKVANQAGFTYWPGCDLRWGTYGLMTYRMLRAGMYAPLLRNWYKYHRAEEVLVIFSEDFYTRMSSSFCQLHCAVDPVSAENVCGKPEEDWPERRSNGQREGHPPMLEDTRKLLTAFYAPYNEELFALLGRRAAWTS